MKSSVHSEWQGALLVCAKCSRKVDGGFGKNGRRSLAKMLRKALGLKKGRRAVLGVVETKCLGACPKGAVTLVDTARPGEWLLVRPGASVTEVLERLGRGTPPDQA